MGGDIPEGYCVYCDEAPCVTLEVCSVQPVYCMCFDCLECWGDGAYTEDECPFQRRSRLDRLATNLATAAGLHRAHSLGVNFACVWLTGQHVAEADDPPCKRCGWSLGDSWCPSCGRTTAAP